MRFRLPHFKFIMPSENIVNASTTSRPTDLGILTESLAYIPSISPTISNTSRPRHLSLLMVKGSNHSSSFCARSSTTSLTPNYQRLRSMSIAGAQQQGRQSRQSISYQSTTSCPSSSAPRSQYRQSMFSPDPIFLEAAHTYAFLRQTAAVKTCLQRKEPSTSDILS